MRRRWLLWTGVALLAFGGLGCPSDELIGTVTPQWRLLAAVRAGEHTRLALYAMPVGTLISDDVYSTANGEPLGGAVTCIEQFRSMLFLLQPDQQRIEVLDATSFRRIARISTAPYRAHAICFANGTTAYTANGDSTVGIIDLTVFRLVRTLMVGKEPVAIAAMGNQVGVCNRRDGTVSIIDTRTNAVTATVSVAPQPVFIVGGNDPVTSFTIVSAGRGKLGDSGPPSAAMLSFYDPFQRQIGAQIELSQAQGGPEQTIPFGLVASGSGSAYVLLDQEVQLVDVVGQRMLGAVLSTGVQGGTYNFPRDLVVLWAQSEGGTLVVALDPISAVERSRTTLPVTFQTAAGL
ncbi:MAG: cytochrome D1 domain-containing protein [Bacteroidota bacterium]|nr:hypothetical protein [Candidatus Kapabacteria bacterium]MCX7936988.1 hypothetical protein [Chlorobiota bacterium]MDW8272132.1 cytochrome D1 domain-containing protein [Bacteroidota bacterium]